MEIKNGFRKFIAFNLLLLVFFLIALAILIAAVLKEGTLDIYAYSTVFIPLGTGLASIGIFFFGANVFEHINKK